MRQYHCFKLEGLEHKTMKDMLTSSERTSRRGFWLSTKEGVSLHPESGDGWEGEVDCEEPLTLSKKFWFYYISCE